MSALNALKPAPKKVEVEVQESDELLDERYKLQEISQSKDN